MEMHQLPNRGITLTVALVTQFKCHMIVCAIYVNYTEYLHVCLMKLLYQALLL